MKKVLITLLAWYGRYLTTLFAAMLCGLSISLFILITFKIDIRDTGFSPIFSFNPIITYIDVIAFYSSIVFFVVGLVLCLPVLKNKTYARKLLLKGIFGFVTSVVFLIIIILYMDNVSFGHTSSLYMNIILILIWYPTILPFALFCSLYNACYLPL